MLETGSVNALGSVDGLGGNIVKSTFYRRVCITCLHVSDLFMLVVGQRDCERILPRGFMFAFGVGVPDLSGTFVIEQIQACAILIHLQFPMI